MAVLGYITFDDGSPGTLRTGWVSVGPSRYCTELAGTVRSYYNAGYLNPALEECQATLCNAFQENSMGATAG